MNLSWVNIALLTHVKLQSFLSDFLDNLINHSYSNSPTPLPHDKDWYGRIIPWKDLCPTLKFLFKWYLIWGNLLPPPFGWLVGTVLLYMWIIPCIGIFTVSTTLVHEIIWKKIYWDFWNHRPPPFYCPPPPTPTTTDLTTIVHLINSPYRII